jgi:hypothetical protein
LISSYPINYIVKVDRHGLIGKTQIVSYVDIMLSKVSPYMVLPHSDNR